MDTISSLLAALLKIGAVALLFNELRGIALAAPVMWGMYKAGGTAMAVWLGVSSLAGIALSVAIPAIAAHYLRKRMMRQTDTANTESCAVPAA